MIDEAFVIEIILSFRFPLCFLELNSSVRWLYKWVRGLVIFSIDNIDTVQKKQS